MTRATIHVDAAITVDLVTVMRFVYNIGLTMATYLRWIHCSQLNNIKTNVSFLYLATAVPLYYTII